MITTAMVLAAGLGKRMRPLTETIPKPLVPVAGRTLLDRALDRLVEAGVMRAVVNVHYLADQLRDHLAGRKDLEIIISDETDALLETGGGLVRALPLLGDESFYVVNSDSLWLNGREDALRRLGAAWDAQDMDALLLLQQTVYAFGYDGLGDFQLGPSGEITRRPEGEVVPYVFMGVQILNRRLFDDLPEACQGRKFSLNPLYDRAIEQGRIRGLLHDGEWFHVGTPPDREVAETFLSQRYAGRERR
ncbi:MAG: nucleotidyltransferase family protein [Magnetovibrionaceae bacterium]